ncbi:hypothetical protein D6V10_21030, partial [Vibrio cholerae]|nr:hypothetical protein [Vibrio cholerae]
TVLVESDEHRGPFILERIAVQDLWNKLGEIVGALLKSPCIVSRRVGIAGMVHLVALVRSQPHEVRRTGTIEIRKK